MLIILQISSFFYHFLVETKPKTYEPLLLDQETKEIFQRRQLLEPIQVGNQLDRLLLPIGKWSSEFLLKLSHY